MFLSENAKILTVLQPDADRYDSDPASDIVFMGDHDHVTFILAEGAGGTGTTVITVEECTDNAGTGAAAIAFKYREMATIDVLGAMTDAAAAGFTTTAGANKVIVIEVPAASLSDGSPYVRVQTTESVDGAVDAGMIAILSGGRYKGASLPSVI
jgi:hypothetical protein